ncbi:MAG: methylmalonyl-CoA mutase family protein [Pseudomonadales bacterium]
MNSPVSIKKAQPLVTPVRIITAAARFDGHDAAIHVLRRLLQQRGCEVIHLGHNRSVKELVRAAVQEDVHALAISSYQGGHMGFFSFLLQQLRNANAGHVQVFCGGGGTITPSEADDLEALGVTRVYSAGHHDTIGLQAIAVEVISLSQKQQQSQASPLADHATRPKCHTIARQLSLLEAGTPLPPTNHLRSCSVVGITGTGGSGKSTLLDTLLSHFLNAFPERHFAVLAIDPTRRRSGGALLGDRIRINSLDNPRVFFRSMATRRPDAATSATLNNAITFLRRSGFDLVFVETAGIGQGNAEIKDLVDVSLYVMTPEYGSPGQLEKIEMLDWADLVVLNKADRPGSEDALQQVKKQWCYNHHTHQATSAEQSVFSCAASLGSGHGINKLFKQLCKKLSDQTLHSWDHSRQEANQKNLINAPSAPTTPISRRHYLSEITHHARQLQQQHNQRIDAASQAFQLFGSLQLLNDKALPNTLMPYSEQQLSEPADNSLQQLRQNYNQALTALTAEDIGQLKSWPQQQLSIHNKHYHYQIRDKLYQGDNFTDSPAHLPIAKLAMPDTKDWGHQLKFLLNENLPGHYPFTAGVFPYRRKDETPTRMFAGEGSPEQTNHRFHYLSSGQDAIRLSTAFDPVTLYGEDPSLEPDTLSRVGMSGVSVATLNDMKILYSGIDLSAPQTSVSLTINGPAPILLAQFFHAAIDREVERHLYSTGKWNVIEKKLQQHFKARPRPQYQGNLPAGHDGSGLALLGIDGAKLVSADTYQKIRSQVLHNIRGTLQADILKEDQAQNECIFDVEFALKLMGDVQEWCLEEGVKNFYTVSVSGYHMAEAGANPVTQLAFTLANGFTLLEYFIARGLDLNTVASQMSFFFSNALDPEYAVIGRVARRIWARALKELYGANEQAQRFKYHIQTSGRSLQSRDIDLNDVRTTLQALYASLDNCNSLHTNAYDEAITTPTEPSVRRALGIQAILQKELGLSLNQNTLQGSYFIEELTHAVELAVYDLFEQLDERGGVFGAMETGFQRNRIQQESMEYEQRKQDGSQPIVGVNCFEDDKTNEEPITPPLTRINESEQQKRVQVLQQFHSLHIDQSRVALKRMKTEIRQGDNAFSALMDAVPFCSLGQLTYALYEVGGHYRRRL